MPFSWCVVAVTFPIYCRSTSSGKPPYIHFRCVAGIHGGCSYPSRRRWLLPGTWSHLWFAGVRDCPPWCSIIGITVTVHQFFCILHFCHTCSLCRVELVVQFPARGSTQVLCLFPGVLSMWHFLYSVGPHPVSSLHIYTFVVPRAFMAGAASHAGDTDSSRALCLTSGLQGSVNVHHGALLLVSQWQCISSFVFYIFVTIVLFAMWSW